MAKGIPHCKCCEKQRQANRKPPLQMTLLGTKTQFRKFQVLACETCDGPVVPLSRRKDKPQDLDLDASTRPEDG